MKSAFFTFYALAGLLSCLAGEAFSAVEAPPKPAAPAEMGMPLASHRAVYDMRLAKTRNGGRVSSIEGKMYVSVKEDCNDWDIQQKMKLRFYYTEGNVTDNETNLISRESKDGKSYNFWSSHSSDGGEPVVLRGEANLSDNGVGKASYGEGGKEIPFESATLFPIHHTLEILRNAHEGKKFFNINVFDGSDEEGYSQIGTFIGTAPDATKQKASLEKSALINVHGWPVRMAFFAPSNSGAAPDYEMDVRLLENGVIKSMLVDYGDFSMSAELVKIEPIKANKCTANKS